MTAAWLRPLAAALDGAAEPVTFFFRDDDAGWADARLRALLDVFAERAVPIDLAAIPVAVTPPLARALLARAGRVQPLAVHQHGYLHVSHEPEGRRCEFGPARSVAAQRADIAAGRQRLEQLFGPELEPVFTPPWNRCTAATGTALVQLGIGVLSRDRTATALDLDGLRELPVQVDWFAKRKGVPLGRAAVGEQLAACAAERAPLGVMLHHADIEEEEGMAALGDLLDMVCAHDGARCLSMAAVLEESTMETTP